MLLTFAKLTLAASTVVGFALSVSPASAQGHGYYNDHGGGHGYYDRGHRDRSYGHRYRDYDHDYDRGHHRRDYDHGHDD